MNGIFKNVIIFREWGKLINKCVKYLIAYSTLVFCVLHNFYDLRISEYLCIKDLPPYNNP
jgi:hypothetical protein